MKDDHQPLPAGKKDDVDIFSMLTTAQKNFMTSSSPNPQPAQQQKSQQQQHPVYTAAPQVVQPPMQNHVHHPVIIQKNNAVNVPAPNDITVPTVANFFAAAQKPMKANPPNNRQAPQHNPNQGVPGNACPTVEEIEMLYSVMKQPSVSPKPIVATPQVPAAVNSKPLLSKLRIQCLLPIPTYSAYF